MTTFIGQIVNIWANISSTNQRYLWLESVVASKNVTLRIWALWRPPQADRRTAPWMQRSTQKSTTRWQMYLYYHNIRHVLVTQYTSDRHQNVYGSDFKVVYKSHTKTQPNTLFGEGTSTKCTRTMRPTVRHNGITQREAGGGYHSAGKIFREPPKHSLHSETSTGVYVQ